MSVTSMGDWHLEKGGGLNAIPVNESQKFIKSKVVSNIGSLFTL